MNSKESFKYLPGYYDVKRNDPQWDYTLSHSYSPAEGGPFQLYVFQGIKKIEVALVYTGGWNSYLIVKDINSQQQDSVISL